MPAHEITLRFLAEPTDVNFGGKVFGGNVMKWIDHAGYTCAATWSSSYCVTASVGDIQFLQPIYVGDLVELRAEIMYTGHSSMHISVSLHARNPRDAEARFTTHCVMVFVAVDGQGKPTGVPAFSPESERSHQLNEYAQDLIDLRRGRQEKTTSFLKSLSLSEAD